MDIVIMKDGDRYDGEIRRDNGVEIRMMMLNGNLAILPHDRIAEIQRDVARNASSDDADADADVA